MSYEDQTVKSFSDNADDYASRQATWEFQERERNLFLASIPAGGKILDVGCGPGNDAKRFHDLGYAVLGIDGAEGMVRLTQEKGVPAKVCKYSELNSITDRFDGIWASYSLLHIPKAELAGVLLVLKSLLAAKGVLYASFREGSGEEMRQNDRYATGRYFAYYHKEELEEQFRKVFPEIESDYVENRDEVRGGVYILART